MVLLVASSGPGTVSLVLLCTALPQLLGPVAGTIADRVDQRRLLACCEGGQGVVYVVIAVGRPPLYLLLPLVIVASTLAALMAPAGRAACPGLCPRSACPGQRAARAGPEPADRGRRAIGGALAGLAGLTAAFALNAASFFISALLLTRLGPLPPELDAGTTTMRADARAGLRYAARNPVLRALVLGTVIFVAFAAIDNVALVFLVQRSLHGSAAGYGTATAAFGVSMVAASVLLAVLAGRRPAAFWLIGGVIAGSIGTAATGLAPSLLGVCFVQALAGAGNTADLVGTDTLVQQSVPAGLLGRAFGTVYAAAQLASVIAYAAAAPLVALTGPRAAFVIAGTGMLAGLAVLVPALAGRRSEARALGIAYLAAEYPLRVRASSDRRETRPSRSRRPVVFEVIS